MDTAAYPIALGVFEPGDGFRLADWFNPEYVHDQVIESCESPHFGGLASPLMADQPTSLAEPENSSFVAGLDTTIDQSAMSMPEASQFWLQEPILNTNLALPSLLPMYESVQSAVNPTPLENPGSTNSQWATTSIDVFAECEINSSGAPIQTLSPKTDTQPRKRPPRLSAEAKAVLEEYYATTRYPCHWELEIIAHRAKIEVKRVRTWFNNARARRTSPARVDASRPDVSDGNWKRLSKESLETLDEDPDPRLQPPMEAYLAQPIGSDSVNLTAVEATIDGPDSVRPIDYAAGNPEGTSKKPPSVVTSLGSSAGSVGSGSSHGSNTSSLSRTRRKGRRRYAWKQSPYEEPSGERHTNRPFFCTFECGKIFRTPWEWARHEEAVHANQKSWVCCQEPPWLLPVVSCFFCGFSHPDEAHMMEHNFQKCNERPEEKRTFYRKDNFAQHLHRAHFQHAKHPTDEVGCKTNCENGQGSGGNFGCAYLIAKWQRYDPSREVPSLQLCGFCGAHLADWNDRCSHIRRHFESGKKVTQAEWWTSRLPAPSWSTHPGVKTSKLWSCRFLRSVEHITEPVSLTRDTRCLLCMRTLSRRHSLEHAVSCHSYRTCDQELFPTLERFLVHLRDQHGTALLNSGVAERYTWTVQKRGPLPPSPLLGEFLMGPFEDEEAERSSFLRLPRHRRKQIETYITVDTRTTPSPSRLASTIEEIPASDRSQHNSSRLRKFLPKALFG